MGSPEDIGLLVSVDPGAHSAVAQWTRDGDGWELGRVVTVKFSLVRYRATPLIATALQVLADLGVGVGSMVVLEGQYHRPGTSFKRVCALVENRCAWQNAAQVLGAETEVVSPAVWITEAAPKDLGESTKERIEAACSKAMGWATAERLVADERDAALLGHWWIERQKRCE